MESDAKSCTATFERPCFWVVTCFSCALIAAGHSCKTPSFLTLARSLLQQIHTGNWSISESPQSLHGRVSRQGTRYDETGLRKRCEENGQGGRCAAELHCQDCRSAHWHAGTSQRTHSVAAEKLDQTQASPTTICILSIENYKKTTLDDTPQDTHTARSIFSHGRTAYTLFFWFHASTISDTISWPLTSHSLRFLRAKLRYSSLDTPKTPQSLSFLARGIT